LETAFLADKRDFFIMNYFILSGKSDLWLAAGLVLESSSIYSQELVLRKKFTFWYAGSVNQFLAASSSAVLILNSSAYYSRHTVLDF
jgi:hypothetical protein